MPQAEVQNEGRWFKACYKYGFDALKEFIPWAPQDKTPPVSVIDKAYYYLTKGRILKYDVKNAGIGAWNATEKSYGNLKNKIFEEVKFLNQPNNRLYFAR